MLLPVRVVWFCLLVFLLFPSESTEQDYWRPQGRFGKRGKQNNDLNSILSELIPSSRPNLIRQIESKLNLIKNRFSGESYIEAVGAICLKLTTHESYRCFRITSNDSEELDDSYSLPLYRTKSVDE